MNKRFYTLSLIAALLLKSSIIIAQESTLLLNSSYIGDYFQNLTGGYRNGGGYLGFAKIGLGFDTEDIGLWKGGSFYIGGGNTHGASPSLDYIGDFQVIDNIEAGDHTYLEKLWFQQKLGKFIIRLGLQDLNENFAACETASEYINSSFGIHPVMSSNFCAPIFPLTGIGAEFHYTIAAKWHLQAAIYDGYMTDFEDNPYNTNWNFNKDEGYLIIIEGHFVTKNGIFNLGTFHHSGEDKYGFYAVFEQAIWQNERRSLTPFIQTAFTINEIDNDNYFHAGTGINLEGVLSKKQRDIIGVASSMILLDNNKKFETAIELFYKYNITENLFIQADFQYIINPAATEEKLDNAFVGIFRFGFEL